MQGFQRLGSRLIRVPSWNRTPRSRPGRRPRSSPTPRARSRSAPTARSCSSRPRPAPTRSTCSPSTASAARRESPVVNVEAGGSRSRPPSTARGRPRRRRGRPERRGDLRPAPRRHDRRADAARRPARRRPAGSSTPAAPSTPRTPAAAPSRLPRRRRRQLTALGTTATDAGTVDAAVSSDGRPSTSRPAPTARRRLSDQRETVPDRRRVGHRAAPSAAKASPPTDRTTNAEPDPVRPRCYVPDREVPVRPHFVVRMRLEPVHAGSGSRTVS